MAVTFNAAGAVAGSPGIVTSAAPGMPTGFLANDIHVVILYSDANLTWAFPAGWTKKIDVANSTTGQFVVAWKRAATGDTAPTITCTGGAAAVMRMAGFRGAINSGDPFDASGSQNNAASLTVTAPAITPRNAGDLLLFAGGQGSGVNTAATFSGYSGTNPVFVEAFQSNVNSASGPNDARIFLAYGTKTDMATTGSRTATSTLSEVNTGALLTMIAQGSLPTNYQFIKADSGMSVSEKIR